MGEHRIDRLEERVESLRERTEHLQEEFDSVRHRTRHLQDRRSATSGEPLAASEGRPASDRPRSDRSDHGLGPVTSGASDEEVAAAVRRVETDTEHETEERDRTEIIVA